MPLPEKEFLSIQEAVAKLGIDEETLFDYARRKLIKLSCMVYNPATGEYSGDVYLEPEDVALTLQESPPHRHIKKILDEAIDDKGKNVLAEFDLLISKDDMKVYGGELVRFEKQYGINQSGEQIEPIPQLEEIEKTNSHTFKKLLKARQLFPEAFSHLHRKPSVDNDVRPWLREKLDCTTYEVQVFGKILKEEFDL